MMFNGLEVSVSSVDIKVLLLLLYFVCFVRSFECLVWGPFNHNLMQLTLGFPVVKLKSLMEKL
jgi:hypothetical protein